MTGQDESPRSEFVRSVLKCFVTGLKCDLKFLVGGPNSIAI